MAIPGLMHLPLLDLRYQDPSKTTINLEEDIIIYLHQTWFIDKKRDQNKKNGIVMDCPKIEDAPTIVFFNREYENDDRPWGFGGAVQKAAEFQHTAAR